jgi:hypothetical protein
VIEIALIAVAYLVGLAVGRWPVVLTVVILGGCLGAFVEIAGVERWVLAVGYAAIAGAGAALGVWTRRLAAMLRA